MVETVENVARPKRNRLAAALRQNLKRRKAQRESLGALPQQVHRKSNDSMKRGGSVPGED